MQVQSCIVLWDVGYRRDRDPQRWPSRGKRGARLVSCWGHGLPVDPGCSELLEGREQGLLRVADPGRTPIAALPSFTLRIVAPEAGFTERVRIQ